VSERTTATRKKFEKEKKNSDAIVEVVFERERGPRVCSFLLEPRGPR
jgi:hypothetical protein